SIGLWSRGPRVQVPSLTPYVLPGHRPDGARSSPRRWRMPSRGRRAPATLLRAIRRRLATKALSMPAMQSAIVRVGSLVPFAQWERRGWHLTPNHFYSPIPDTRELG